MKTITGTITHVPLATGTWGIIDTQGNQWLPVNMPEQLKTEGKKVTVTIKEVDEMSVFMWGTPVRILSFQT
ncbi:MAG TPA: hypothetical protein ENJ20_04960 [Bacteroidetes bacterium]|nr:hypothetical protein [Bacteroidota bacterium]